MARTRRISLPSFWILVEIPKNEFHCESSLSEAVKLKEKDQYKEPFTNTAYSSSTTQHGAKAEERWNS